MKLFTIIFFLLIIISSYTLWPRKDDVTNSAAYDNYHIKIVGSSTVYPFVTIIAEEFGKNSKFKTPIIEATGTGGGMKLFCAKESNNSPDFVNASRLMKKSEIKICQENNIGPVNKIKIGYDAIVLANLVSAKNFSLTYKDIFLAIASEIPYQGKLVKNFYKKWSDINPNLPNQNIKIYGPPPSSGTRDVFTDIVMKKACVTMPEYIAKYPNKNQRKNKCSIIRSDNKFIEVGENDNLIIRKLKNDDQAIGIFGYHALEENSANIKAIKINSIYPKFYEIANGKYPLTRSLYLYLKSTSLKQESVIHFVQELISQDAIGKYGYLVDRGLIPLPDNELKKLRLEIKNLINNHNE